MVRNAQVACAGGAVRYLDKLTLDTGASSANYIGEKVLERIGNVVRYPCRHNARLGDGATRIWVTESVVLETQVYADDGSLEEPISTEYFVVPTLGDEAIIGLPDILGNYYEFFEKVLRAARERECQPSRITRLYDLWDELVAVAQGTSQRSLRSLSNEARAIGSWYAGAKRRVMQDPTVKLSQQTDASGRVTNLAQSTRFGTVVADETIESMVAAIELAADNPYVLKALHDPWSKPPERCEEDEDTPDPLSFGEDVLHFMEMSVEEARQEYFESVSNHVSEEMKRAVPETMDLLHTLKAQECFSPSRWDGLKIKPVEFVVKGTLPDRIPARARPIRPELYEHARKEFERLCKYFYEVDPSRCTSSIASPLVIAPKATTPFIRFCGDYRRVNEYISIPQTPIPVVVYELTKAARYRVYIDLDMANSFHQIPLGENFSQLLSVQTPWGLVRPKFLPEGVGPASGLLQSIVREIFADFEDWTIVIFDNFLVLADDYRDAYNKLVKVLDRCSEYGVVLKLKKSFIGVPQVSFFGYDVTYGKWELSQTRKDAISAMQFPKSKKEMQSFLGAALFFHHHIPDYSEWVAKLYEMTHDGFVWDASKWTYDYRQHFERFKGAVQVAATLHCPDYSLPWIVRCDASEFAVGAVLYQEFTGPEGDVVHQPIAFSSKRFSGPAQKWDAYKREAFAIYHSVHSFQWYLRGKKFVVESDHRNLQWIEASESPIVVRWRALLQAYDFKVRHIPGKENKVADWMSRQSAPDESDFVVASIQAPVTPTLGEILETVHRGRALHYGAAETWRRAKEAYPQAHIAIQAVRDWVQQCAVCQKTRDTGVQHDAHEWLSICGRFSFPGFCPFALFVPFP